MPIVKKRRPRILFFDIETFPNLSYVWGKYEQNTIAVKRHWYMLCFAYQWQDEKKVHFCSIRDFKEYKKDRYNDFGLIKKLHSLFDEADVVIAHNGKYFDVRKANARFIKHGLTPPSPYLVVDTKQVAKTYFMFDSNKLDDLGDYLGVGCKVPHTGFELWLGCENNNKKMWKTMEKYNIGDIALLRRCYDRMLPYMTNHPNMGLLKGLVVACPNCGSGNMQRRGFGFNRVSKYQRYQCMSCGSWSKQTSPGRQVR
jgi:DNA-directed RNA polymerase subunit RPC12/RpoP/DNA polymerase elongation subunit (family B)